MKNLKLDTKSVVATVVSIVVLYTTVFYASKAWKRGQEGDKLV